MKNHPFPIALIRWLVAAVFIFSGFVKAVDPWGTAIKIGEYMAAFGLTSLAGSRYLLAVVQAVVEMTLGFTLLFRIKERGAVVWTLVVTALFTLLTLVLAIWNPVADCGCFGDAVKLTNWQTFFKNVLLLLLSAVLFVYVRRRGDRRYDRSILRVQWMGMTLFALYATVLSLYALRHLPPIDFLPYRVGAVVTGATASSDQPTTVVYKDRTTGRSREFALNDTTWYDSLRWEYVDTRVAESSASETRSSALPLTLFDAAGDHSAEVFGGHQELFLIVQDELDRPLGTRCGERMAAAVGYAQQHNYKVVCCTAAPLPDKGQITLGGVQIPVYNMDGTTLKMLLRAHRGMVLLKEGTVLGKWSCRDIPHFGDDRSIQTPLGVVLAHNERTVQWWWLGLSGVIVMVAYGAYRRFRRRN